MKASIRLIEVGGKPFYTHALHPVTNKYHFIGEKNCVENQAIQTGFLATNEQILCSALATGEELQFLDWSQRRETIMPPPLQDLPLLNYDIVAEKNIFINAGNGDCVDLNQVFNALMKKHKCGRGLGANYGKEELDPPFWGKVGSNWFIIIGRSRPWGYTGDMKELLYKIVFKIEP